MSDEQEVAFGGGRASDEYSPENSSESSSEDSELTKKKIPCLRRKSTPSTSSVLDLPNYYNDQVKQRSIPRPVPSSDSSSEDHFDANVETNSVEQTINNVIIQVMGEEGSESSDK
ncbi:hypothetical protein QE152_g38027 [Popillia japonica]|uniref:Uncharacterized protein n=1 Tax=Popillia japonica TaxID=7064 RepID=A0AAW1I8N2_POPJA